MERMDRDEPLWFRVPVTSWASLLIMLYLRDEDEPLIEACEGLVWRGETWRL